MLKNVPSDVCTEGVIYERVLEHTPHTRKHTHTHTLLYSNSLLSRLIFFFQPRRHDAPRNYCRRLSVRVGYSWRYDGLREKTSVVCRTDGKEKKICYLFTRHTRARALTHE